MRYARRRHRIPALSLIAVVVGVTLMTSLASGWAGAQAKPKTYPRVQTLITGGTQWGTIEGTNPYVGNYAVGTVGLCNETLLRYDPLKDTYIDWLAEDAEFTGPNEFTVTIRSGIKWSDGEPFTSEDVAWNFRLGRFDTAFWHDLYSNLSSIKVPKVKTRVFVKNKWGKFTKTCRKVKKVRIEDRDKGKPSVRVKRVCKKKIRTVLVPGKRVIFTFAGTPNYAQWQNLLWNLPLISPKQGSSITSPTSLTEYNPENPIGTGPYEFDPDGFDPTTRVVWKKKPLWWAAQKGLAPSPTPNYVIDIYWHSNLNGLSPLLTQVEDLSNSYLPGVQGLVASGQAHTYYPGPPYNLSASTSWLVPNTARKPLDDKAFRRAIAQSINLQQIVTSDYGNLVLPASPSGLLPIWKKWIDNSLVASKGFTYSTAAAKATLDAAGYPKDGSGWYLNKDSSPIDLGVSVPSGWSDWESARDLIIADLQAAKIHAHADPGDFNHYQTERNSGSFDLLIDNSYQLSDNPWTYFNGIFHLPVLANQTFANFERYQNPAAWADVQKLDQTPLEDTSARRVLMSELEGILMDDLPLIPLWYGGLWSQSQSKYWTNWPQDGTERQYTPTMWRGYLQMTGIDMITHLQPVP